MDIWTAPVGARVDLGTGVELTVVDRQDERGTLTLRLRGAGPDGDVVVELRRTPVRAPVLEGFLTAPVSVGTRLTCRFEVEPAMLTDHVPNAPSVLMTPTLIGLMEEVGARIVRPRLAEGAAAVGTFIGVRHTGTALLGELVEVTATVTDRAGRRIGFDVSATVDGRPVGHGQIGFTLVAPRRTTDPRQTIDPRRAVDQTRD